VRALNITFAMLAAAFRGQMQYRVNFVLQVIFGLGYQGTGFIFIWVVLSRFQALAGWSLGQIAFLYGLRLTTHGLFVSLFGSLSELDEQIRAREGEIARSQDYAAEHGIEALALHQIEMGRVPAAVRNDGYLRERFLNRMRSLTTHGFVNSGKARRERTDYHDRLGELAMPVLVIAGERDVLAPAARSMHEGIPGSRLCIIPEAGHPAVSDAPKEFAASVLDFLKEVDGLPRLPAAKRL